MNKNFNKIAKYDNHLNELELGKLNAVELDLFLTISSYIRDKGTDEVVLPLQKIKNTSKYTATQKRKFVQELKQTNKKLMSLNYTIEDSEDDDSEIIQFVLFNTFTINPKEETLTVEVNKNFTYLFNNLTGNFTRFELQEYVDLKSKYSKIIYQLLKQYRKTGTRIIEIDDFRRILDIPKSYTMSDIDKRVFQPALEELNKYFENLSIIKIKNTKKKNAVTKIQFFFGKEEGYLSVNPDEFSEIPDINEENDFILKSMNEVPIFEV